MHTNTIPNAEDGTIDLEEIKQNVRNVHDVHQPITKVSMSKLFLFVLRVYGFLVMSHLCSTYLQMFQLINQYLVFSICLFLLCILLPI